MFYVKCFMAKLEKILADILNNMDSEDIEKETNHISVHDGQNTMKKNENTNEEQQSGLTLDGLIKQSVIQWLKTKEGSNLIENLIRNLVEERVSYFMYELLKEKISDELLENTIKSIIQEKLSK